MARIITPNASKVPSAQFNFRGTGAVETTRDDELSHEAPRYLGGATVVELNKYRFGAKQQNASVVMQ